MYLRTWFLRTLRLTKELVKSVVTQEVAQVSKGRSGGSAQVKVKRRELQMQSADMLQSFSYVCRMFYFGSSHLFQHDLDENEPNRIQAGGLVDSSVETNVKTNLETHTHGHETHETHVRNMDSDEFLSCEGLMSDDHSFFCSKRCTASSPVALQAKALTLTCPINRKNNKKRPSHKRSDSNPPSQDWSHSGTKKNQRAS